ncbi:MAG: ornithine carbamoyltransferase [Synergistetes bacterium]|nr:ornithine carbamoyltransferase [Synergistota bacterium]
MAVTMKGKHLIDLHRWTTEEIEEVLKTAETLKLEKKRGQEHPILKGKTLAMIFQKPSTRTRVSFEVGMYQLGGYALYLGPNDLQLRRGETIADTARVISRYCDGIMARVFSHNDILDLAQNATVPVINGLSDLFHPTQVLADLLTIMEKKGHLKGIKLAFVGDGNNMANSLMFGGAKVGMHVVVASPKEYFPREDIVSVAKADAKLAGGSIAVVEDPVEAVRDADVIYTDVWASMGQEAEAERRRKAFKSYQVNSNLVKLAKPDAIIMHCLPAHRGEEITSEVIDSPQSVVFDEAENRLHAHKAILSLLL